MTVSFEVIKLKFTTPLHIGRGWGDLDHSEPLLHSDTIKSAIFYALIQLYPEWKNKPEKFFQSFSISSCFPYYKEELFLPKLQLKRRFRFEGIESYKEAKTSKKIEYLSLKVFQDYLNARDEIAFNKRQLSKNGKYVLEKVQDNPENIIVSHVQQRVNVKYFSEPVPFFADRLFFNKECGLYFLAQYSDRSIKEDVFHAIKFLGTLGIGTDRTVGNGFYDFDKEKDVSKIEISLDNPDAYAALGLFLPQQEELAKIDMDNSSWGLVKRGGYMAGSEHVKFRHLLKKSIYMFTEGSVFKTTEKPTGKCENVRPEWNDTDMHDVWRCGMPVFIPVKL